MIREEGKVMISNPNPKYGLCNFKLGDFTGIPSYLTDVPVDLLKAFIDFHMKGCGTVWFDEKGTEFSLVLTPYSIFIIDEQNEEPVLHDLSDMVIRKIEKELIEDIESDLYGWGNFVLTDGEAKMHRETILQKIAILRRLIDE